MGLLNDLTLGRFVSTKSPVHSLDPRVKMTGAFALLVIVIAVQGWSAYAILTLTMLMVAVASRLPLGFLFRNLGSLKWLLIVIFVMHALLTDGAPLVASIPWFTREGLVMGGIFAWRVGLMVTIATLLTATTSPVDLGDGLEKLLKPLGSIGLPVHELAMISVIALRFIPTLLDEAGRIMKAQIGRGVSFEGGAVARARSAVPILIPLFASAFRRADELALAMDARCYRGALGRTKYVELKLQRRDGLAIALLVVVAGATLAVPRWF
jgi:energy-coupling factor transport system permease protein